MKNTTRLSFIIFSLIVLFGCSNLFTPKNENYIFLNESLSLSASEISAIEDSLEKVTNTSHVDIGIFIVDKIPEEMDATGYADYKFQKYKLGELGINNSIALIIEMEIGKITIRNAYGVEWLLTDALSGEIIESIISEFKLDRFSEGIIKGIELMGEILGEVSWDIIDFNDDIQIDKILKINTSLIQAKSAVIKNLVDRSFHTQKITVNKRIVELYYTQHMDQLIEMINDGEVYGHIYGRVVQLEPLAIQVIGVEN